MKPKTIQYIWRLFESFINIASTKLITFGISLFLARSLSKAEFGQYAYLYATVLLFQTIASLSMASTASKYIGISKNNHRAQQEIALFAIAITSLGGTIGGAIYLMMTYHGIIYMFINSNTIQISLAAAIVAGTITPAVRGIAIGNQEIRKLTLANIYTAIIYIPTLIILIKQFGYIGAMYSISLYFIIELATNLIATNSRKRFTKIRPTLSSLSSHAGILKDFSVPSAISGILIALTTWLGLHILSKQGNGEEELADFAIANQWRIMLLLLPAIIENATLPIISYAAKYSKESLSKHIETNTTTIIALGFFATAALTIFAENILSLYGRDYTNSIDTFQIMLFAGYAFAINAVIGQIITATGNMWHGLILNGIWSAIYIVSIAFFAHSAKELAACFLVSYIAHLVIQTVYLKLMNRRRLFP